MTFGDHPRYTKECPGRCGTRANVQSLVCSNCWDLLPRPLRDEIMSWQAKSGKEANANRLRLRHQALRLLRQVGAHA